MIRRLARDIADALPPHVWPVVLAMCVLLIIGGTL